MADIKLLNRIKHGLKRLVEIQKIFNSECDALYQDIHDAIKINKEEDSDGFSN